MEIVANIILLMLTSIVLFIGIQFYFKNKVTSNKTRHYVLGYCIFSGLWCFCYGVIGITADFNHAMILRAIGVFAINGFSIVEVFLLSGMGKDRKEIRIPSRVIAILLGVVDVILFAKKDIATFIRVGNWTTWVSNPEYATERILHSVIVLLYVLIMFILGVRWYRSTAFRRQKRFILCVFVANFCMLFLTVPDTLFPMLGRYIIPTSGMGSAICTIVIWYGASVLNSFDINIVNVFEKIYKFIDAGVLVFDTEKNLVLTNPFGERLIPDDTHGKTGLGDLFDVTEEETNSFFSNTVDGIVSRRFEALSNHNIYSLKNSVLMDDYDEPYGYLCVLLDVTDEINMVNELEAANNAKTTFLTSISHEIRTPINAVLGFSEILSKMSSDEEIVSCAEDISRAGGLLLSIINDLLDMSKVKSGNLSIEPIDYNLSDVLSDVYLLHSVNATAKGLSFTMENNENIPKLLHGDSLRIQQIITNLITNAIKYTDTGNVVFTLDYRDINQDSIDLIISISDTGMGIREEDMPYLFDAFTRFDSEKNRHIQGTGVGLSIIKTLVDEMSGTIEVSSEYGKGSKFIVTLPQEIISREPIGKTSDWKKRKKSVEKIESQYTAPDACLLTVDDNNMNLKVFAGLVRPLGIKADTASEGLMALEMIKNKKYDIIFLDHMMPGMDGIEVLKGIKEDKTHPNQETPIIVMTANCIDGAKEEYLQQGFNDYVGKPIKGDLLTETIRRHLNPNLIVLDKSQEAENEALNIKHEIFNTDIQGVDWNLAYSHTADYELLLEVIETFYAMADKEIANMNGYYDNICLEDKINTEDLEAALHSYRISAHTMKNSLAMVGAGELSENAKALETACKNNDLQFIIDGHKTFAKEYLDLAKRLQLAATGSLDEGRRLMTNDELSMNLDKIKTAIEEFDLVSLNEVSFTLDCNNYESEEIASYVDKIRASIINLDQDNIIKNIDELKKII